MSTKECECSTDHLNVILLQKNVAHLLIYLHLVLTVFDYRGERKETTVASNCGTVLKWKQEITAHTCAPS